MVSLWGRQVASWGGHLAARVAGPSDFDGAGLLMLRDGATALGVTGGVGDVGTGYCGAMVGALIGCSAGSSLTDEQQEECLKKQLFRLTCVPPRLAVIIDPFLPATTSGSSWYGLRDLHTEVSMSRTESPKAMVDSYACILAPAYAFIFAFASVSRARMSTSTSTGGLATTTCHDLRQSGPQAPPEEECC